MISIPSQHEPFIDEDGKVKPAWHTFLVELQRRLNNIAQVDKPSGGATVDAEARTAIDGIIDASG